MKSKTLSNQEVKHIANLANLKLTEEEVKKFQKQLGATISYIKTLKKISGRKVTGKPYIKYPVKVLRDDLVKASLSQEEALNQAKQTERGFFKIDAILEEK